MIRSIGSSLLAKSAPGSLSRKAQETRITKPEIPGKGAVGTSARELTEQTNITPTAPGSEKVVRAAPGLESASLPGIAANQVPLVAGIASPGGAAPASAPGGGNQPMFTGKGLMTPGAASNPGQAGRQASAIATMSAPRGQVAGARTEFNGVAPTMGAVSQAAAARVPIYRASLPDIGIFGARTQAGEPGGGSGQTTAASATGARPGEYQPTAAQYAAGRVGSIINKVGQKLGNILPNFNVSEKLERYGGSQSVAAAGKGSVTKAAQNVSGALRSVVQQAQNTISKLRSKLFGR